MALCDPCQPLPCSPAYRHQAETQASACWLGPLGPRLERTKKPAARRNRLWAHRTATSARDRIGGIHLHGCVAEPRSRALSCRVTVSEAKRHVAPPETISYIGDIGGETPSCSTSGVRQPITAQAACRAKSFLFAHRDAAKTSASRFGFPSTEKASNGRGSGSPTDGECANAEPRRLQRLPGA